ncbi:MAG: hypothetical protein ACI8RN_001472 [Glaciecola sp.]|jgi:hypothetical protein|uniref:hypothetical protein n=1 Tax=Congregibacter sp. TaxID=2744308 RepID=UPI0039E47073
MLGISVRGVGFVLFVCLFIHLSSAVFAQSPITIEQLLAKPSSWQISSSFDYRSGMSESWHLERQTSWSAGVRYGLTPRFEINGRLQGQQFSQDIPGQRIREQSQALSVGSNWLLKPESATPALLLEARAVLRSSGPAGPRHLPSVQVAITSYKSIDPVVLSLSASVNVQREYRLGSVEVSPGSSWRLEPGVNFAINPRVTLFGGVAIERRNSTQFGAAVIAGPSERLALSGGMALAVARQHSVFVSGDVASDRSGGMSLQWFYEF